MSRWYDNHRLEKRLRVAERLQLIGALSMEDAIEHLIEKTNLLNEAIKEIGGRDIRTTTTTISNQLVAPHIK